MISYPEDLGMQVGAICCVDRDVDRQNITVFNTPDQIDGLIFEKVTKLSSLLGELMMIYYMLPRGSVYLYH